MYTTNERGSPMASTRLTSAEREFFAALDEVVYGNPFSDEREKLIQQLVPGATLAELNRDQEALRRLVELRLGPYQSLADLQRLVDEDLQLVQAAFLYVCYHRHIPPLDELIARQVAGQPAGAMDRPARSVFAELAQCGFDEDEAARYFAFFYQLRRGYHFILRLTGACESMRKLRRGLWNNIFTHDMRAYHDSLSNRLEDFSTLLLGETGTGSGALSPAWRSIKASSCGTARW